MSSLFEDSFLANLSQQELASILPAYDSLPAIVDMSPPPVLAQADALLAAPLPPMPVSYEPAVAPAPVPAPSALDMVNQASPISSVPGSPSSASTVPFAFNFNNDNVDLGKPVAAPLKSSASAAASPAPENNGPKRRGRKKIYVTPEQIAFKRARDLEKNRVAAQASRQRKKSEFSSLMQDLEKLHAQNTELSKQLAALRAEHELLRGKARAAGIDCSASPSRAKSGGIKA